MTQDQVKQMQEDFKTLQKAEQKKSKIHSVISHIGKKGRSKDIGKWQNQFDCKVQVALQYTEGGQCYWHEDELNKEFVKTIHENFDQLLMKTIQRTNLEYEKALSIFDKYKVQTDE